MYYSAVLTFVLFVTLVCGQFPLQIVNKCKYDIWPAGYAVDSVTKRTVGMEPSMDFRLGQDAERTVYYKIDCNQKYDSARVWARRGCEERDGQLSCLIGDCLGQRVCLSGAPNASLAEFTYDNGRLIYDISLVDAWTVDLSMSMKGHDDQTTICKANDQLLQDCPESHRLADTGNFLGCLTDCKARNDTNSCCKEERKLDCTSSSTFLTKACPNVYTWPNQDKIATQVTRTILNISQNDALVITFCPS